jgi:hypothetical protein
MDFEAVIGLEVHVQVKTRSKMFSRTAAGFGHPPNTLTDPVVLALPGALPVINRAALDQVIKAGLMLDCEIAPVCKWDRKNYFYPDSPKNYQISQYDRPICLGGRVEIELPGPARNVMGPHRWIPLTRIHLEEDVGKLSHGADGSLVDLNRAGTPLMEIVSEPALRSADEAHAFLTALRSLMVAAGVSDCDMEKGQMRCDANVSIRPAGSEALGTKVELKNLNSISFVRDGIGHEIRRQEAVVAAGGTIVQETRDYDGQAGTSRSLRSKEMAHDYRYFPDPDLMPVRVDEAWKARLRAACPERPFDRQRRYFERLLRRGGGPLRQAAGRRQLDRQRSQKGAGSGAADPRRLEGAARARGRTGAAGRGRGDSRRRGARGVRRGLPHGGGAGRGGREARRQGRLGRRGRTRTLVPRGDRRRSEGRRGIQGGQGERDQRVQGPRHARGEGQGRSEARRRGPPAAAGGPELIRSDP